MVQMKVRDDNTINVRGDGTFGHDVREIWESSFISEAHMHATIEHYILATHREQNAASSDILASSQRSYFDIRHAKF